MKNILVFFGGVSCEHEVSVITGVMVTNCLDGKGYNAVPVYVDKSGAWHSGEELKNVAYYSGKITCAKVAMLPSDDTLYEVKKSKLKPILKVDCAINCMHGLNGEDGTIPGYLRLVGVPLASPQVFASAVSMDKYYTKIALSGLKVPYLPYVRLKRENYYKNKAFARKLVAKLGYPVIIKPANLGSSIGITVVKNDSEFSDAAELAFLYDDKIIAEKALTNFKEINCACYKLGGKYVTSPCEEPVTKHDVLTFDDKYVLPADKKFPADIPAKTADKIRELTAFVYRKLDFTGIIRIDYLVSEGGVYLNEINSVPGSLAYYLFTRDTDEFGELLENLIDEAIGAFADFKSNVFTYSAPILTDFKGNKK